MKVVIAIDSYKGSLSSMQAGMAAMEGIKRVYPECEVKVCPIGDGGEGTVDAIIEGLDASEQIIEVTGPLGETVKAKYAISKNNTAIIEMSAAAGITLVPEEKRNPLNTTTYGVGEIILDAIKKGCRNFIIGIGGSATNDGGVGMLQALGYGILDKNGNQVSYGAIGLKELHKITYNNVLPELKDCKFNIACDVINPLCGENGCSAVYGPQKGADSDMIIKMDEWLLKYSKLVKEINPSSDKDVKGTGAAGGIGFAFLSFLNGDLKNGIELILNETKIEEHIKNADMVITGEGRIDSQTAMGKAPAGVSRLAKKYDIPVIAFGGVVSDDSNLCNDCGIDAIFPIIRKVSNLEEAMNIENSRKNMINTVEQVFRLINKFDSKIN